MFHISAYTVLVGQTVNTVVTPLADQILQTRDNAFFSQFPLNLVWSWNGSTTLNRARFVTPRTRMIDPPFLRPIQAATTPPTDPSVVDLRGQPFRVSANENMSVEATSDLAMGTERFTSVIGLTTGLRPKPNGDIYTLRGQDTSTAATANAWTDLSITWDQGLPVGTYALVGLQHVSANGIAARAILEGEWWRPGSLSVTAVGNRSHPMFSRGGLGEWGRFTHTTRPTISVLCDQADATHDVYMDVIKVS